VNKEMADYILAEIHGGDYGLHVNEKKKNLAVKVLKVRFYWLPFLRFALFYKRKCGKCQYTSHK